MAVDGTDDSCPVVLPLTSSPTGWCVEGRPLLPSASLVPLVLGQACGFLVKQLEFL